MNLWINQLKLRASLNFHKNGEHQKDLSLNNIIGQIDKGVFTRNSLNIFCEHMDFVSQIEPKTISKVINDVNWFVATHDELNQFTRNDVTFLVPKYNNMNVIGTKWVFKNKLYEYGMITINKVKLFAKGYNQEKGINYEETCALISRLEVVRLLFVFACMSGFKLFQMDIKIAFLNGFINEVVYVSQPPDSDYH